MSKIELMLGLLLFLSFMLISLAVGRRVQNWQRKAEILLGLTGSAPFALALYERFTHRANSFLFTKGLLAGVSIGVFVALCMEGTLKFWYGKEHRTHPREH